LHYWWRFFLQPGARKGGKRQAWATALAVFAVSALHLSHHRGGADAWYTELLGHHASLPLALAILYETIASPLPTLS
jgi:hypothetical protein